MIDSFMGRSADEISEVHERFNPPAPDWFASCAASGHPLLRRIAASFPRLPGDLVGLLASDPDDDVRHLLAYNHPDAPSHLLLEAFIAARRQSPHLLGHPRLPRTGLVELLDHEDPDVRALAVGDTTLPSRPSLNSTTQTGEFALLRPPIPTFPCISSKSSCRNRSAPRRRRATLASP
jgi:hypothetical protein